MNVFVQTMGVNTENWISNMVKIKPDIRRYVGVEYGEGQEACPRGRYIPPSW